MWLRQIQLLQLFKKLRLRSYYAIRELRIYVDWRCFLNLRFGVQLGYHENEGKSIRGGDTSLKIGDVVSIADAAVFG